MGSQEVIVPQEIHKRLNELKQTTYKDVYVVDADYKPITWYRAEGEKKGRLRKSGYSAKVFNYGGGVQSVCLTLLIAAGIVEKPDIIVFADTGREVPTTKHYLETYVQPILKEIGLQVHIAPHSLASCDLYSLQGAPLMPLYGPAKKLYNFCSHEWKKYVVDRYTRQTLPDTTQRTLRHWLGISTDEARRANKETYFYPLIHLGFSRNDCKDFITKAGLPLPHKSRCWMCPYQTKAEWAEIARNEELVKAVIELEQDIQEDYPDLYVHSSRKPIGVVLKELQASAQTGVDTPRDMCETGFCFV